MSAVRRGVAAALVASSAACALLAGIERPTERPGDGGLDATAMGDSKAGSGDGPVRKGDGGSGPDADAGTGSEVASCDPEHIRCDGACVDPLTDSMNCGACGTHCGPTTASCVVGYCVTPYYLAPDGSDDAGGETPGTAWKTFAYAMPKLESGNALVLVDGTYTTDVNGMPVVKCPPAHNGNGSTGPIVVAAQNERRAVLSSNGSEPAISLVGCQNWVVYGLTATTTDFAFDAGRFAPDTVQIMYSGGIELRRLLVVGNNRHFWTSAVSFYNVTDSLIADSEIYDFTVNGLWIGSVSDVEARRVYVNSRGARDLDGGVKSGDPSQGDNGIFAAVEGDSGTIIENSVTEFVQYGHVVQGVGTAALLGSMSHGCTNGTSINAGGLSLVVRDWVSLDEGFDFGALASADVANMTLLSGSGISLGGTQGVMVDTQSAYGTGQGLSLRSAGWSVDYSNFGSNDGVDYPDASTFQHCTSTQPTQVGSGKDECIVYVLPTSNMAHAGADGGPIGANIIYRYEHGALTTTRLWGSDGSFPCGATVPHINDNPDASCRGLGARLNFVDGGCPVP